MERLTHLYACIPITYTISSLTLLSAKKSTTEIHVKKKKQVEVGIFNFYAKSRKKYNGMFNAKTLERFYQVKVWY
jgi:hypothetical protein